jgi:hypothetical protein
MPTAHARRRVKAPLERVWTSATDVAGAEQRMSGVEQIELLTPGPFAVGTRWRETRVAAGRPETEEMLVVEAVPPGRFVLELSRGEAVARVVTTLADAGAGETDVEVSLESEPLDVAGRLVGAFFGVLAARSLLAALNRDLDDLARWCERSEGTS